MLIFLFSLKHKKALDAQRCMLYLEFNCKYFGGLISYPLGLELSPVRRQCASAPTPKSGANPHEFGTVARIPTLFDSMLYGWILFFNVAIRPYRADFSFSVIASIP